MIQAVITTFAWAQSPDPSTYEHFALDAEACLQKDVLGEWYPRAVDSQGGFFENFNNDWSLGSDGVRSNVYQARLTWVATQAAEQYPPKVTNTSIYLYAIHHGVDFLNRSQWDHKRGGFFWAVDKQGQPVGDWAHQKVTYGISFAIYALSAAYKVTQSTDALNLAIDAYQWLDAHAHDAPNGGYYEALTLDGEPILSMPLHAPSGVKDAIGVAYGYKSMNTHIHLMESFTSLYEVWPDKKLRSRVQELFQIVRERVAVFPLGALNMFFQPDWQPIPGVNSFGHDIETGFLLTEVAKVLGQPDDARTWKVARALVDHALDFGWDEKHGGFYDEGLPFGPPTDTGKVWWVQAEGLNSLLLMHARYGNTTFRYWEAWRKQWAFIRERQIDSLHGGWYPLVDAAGAAPAGQIKSDSWTADYHTGRALLHVVASLRHLASLRNEPRAVNQGHPLFTKGTLMI